MATTTNYSWTTPDDTALVKDGASAIRSLGTAIDTTTYNNSLLPIVKTIVDAKGDIIAATAADAVSRLAVGANDTVLTADSAQATGLKWATPSSAAKLISRTTFTAAATVTVDSLFSTTYENYLVYLQLQHTTTNSVISVQGRYGSTTHTGSDYSATFFGTDFTANTLTSTRTNAATSWSFATSTITNNNIYNLTFNRSQSSAPLNFTGNMIQRQAGTVLSGGGYIQSSQDWSGLFFSPATGTITGIISVYGLAKA
jgi:hypothetical protein